MDFRQLARYFDRQRFENYDFEAGEWAGTYFNGQLKKSDTFQTIYHRPTRKRMLYCVPGSIPTSAVIRVDTTGEIFMVGAMQQDSHANRHYRDIFALHKPMGNAYIYRRAPVGPANNPGWAIETLVETTFGDIEMRSVNENEESLLVHRGHYFLTLPGNSIVRRNDVVLINGVSYAVLEFYSDSALISCRVAQHGDLRENLVYKDFVSQTYANNAAVLNFTDYNVTARVGPLSKDEVVGDINATAQKVLIPISWIGVVPDLKDRLTISGMEYRIRKIYKDMNEDHWELVVEL